MFKSSLYELKSIRNLSIIGIFMALAVVLHFTAEVYISQTIHISFGFLIYMIVGSMFGPVVALVFGFLCDILCYIVKTDGAFNIGFTISSMVSVFIYALFLYKLKLDVVRVIASTVVHDIVISFVLNTIWLSYMYHGGDFKKAFLLRFPKSIIMLPINCALAFVVSRMFKKLSEILKLDR